MLFLDAAVADRVCTAVEHVRGRRSGGLVGSWLFCCCCCGNNRRARWRRIALPYNKRMRQVSTCPPCFRHASPINTCRSEGCFPTKGDNFICDRHAWKSCLHHSTHSHTAESQLCLYWLPDRPLCVARFFLYVCKCTRKGPFILLILHVLVCLLFVFVVDYLDISYKGWRSAWCLLAHGQLPMTVDSHVSRWDGDTNRWEVILNLYWITVVWKWCWPFLPTVRFVRRAHALGDACTSPP